MEGYQAAAARRTYRVRYVVVGRRPAARLEARVARSDDVARQRVEPGAARDPAVRQTFAERQ